MLFLRRMEFFLSMKKKRFRIVDQPQYFHVKSSGFRHIEKAAKDLADVTDELARAQTALDVVNNREQMDIDI